MKNFFCQLPLEFKQFYQFLSLHSFLVGLFPVLMPSFLWKKGFSITELAIFIAISGASFVLSLWAWDRIHKIYSFKFIIFISFLAQILLMNLFFFQDHFFFLTVLALLNGAANCFFWITQRALFFETIELSNSGKNFGNFQIFVAIILNISIATGAILLSWFGFIGVYILSMLISLGAVIFYFKLKNPPVLAKNLLMANSVRLKDVVFFFDKYNSKKIFLLDGLFLYLESYFWVISLFLIAHESFLKLGFLIVGVAGILAVIFYLIKNLIDKINSQVVYLLGVIFYSLSWVLRSLADEKLSLMYLFFLLTGITFFTAFFRLAYNKRFFDIAKKTSQHKYLFVKSYCSQIFIVFSFLLIAFVSTKIENPRLLLKYTYIIAAILSTGYFFYQSKKKSKKN